MTLADLIKDFIDSSRERIKTPITGSFIIAFLIFNWRPLLFLMFSDAKMEDKIVVINNEYCTWHAIIVPVLVSFLYVTGVQYIMLGIDRLTTKAYKERKINRYDRQAHDLDKYQNVLAAQKKNEDIRSGNLEKSQLNDQIEKLKNDYENLSQLRQSDKLRFENEIRDLSQNYEEANENVVESNKNASVIEKRNALLIKDSIIYDSLNKLTLSQRSEFIHYVNYEIYNKTNTLTIDATYEDVYRELGLIELHSRRYSLTAKGELLYSYLSVK